MFYIYLFIVLLLFRQRDISLWKMVLAKSFQKFESHR